MSNETVTGPCYDPGHIGPRFNVSTILPRQNLDQTNLDQTRGNRGANPKRVKHLANGPVQNIHVVGDGSVIRPRRERQNS